MKISGRGQMPVDLSGASALRFSIYAKSNITKLGVALNGNFGGDEQSITTTLGQYKVVTIPLSKLGNPSQATSIIIRGHGTVDIFYIDNLGFI